MCDDDDAWIERAPIARIVEYAQRCEDTAMKAWSAGAVTFWAHRARVAWATAVEALMSGRAPR